MVRRGQLWWADLGEPHGSAPAYKRPVVIISANDYNNSRIDTVQVAIVTSNLNYATAPGNVLLKKTESGLSKDSVVNVTHFTTVDKTALDELVCLLKPRTMQLVDDGLRLAIDL